MVPMPDSARGKRDAHERDTDRMRGRMPDSFVDQPKRLAEPDAVDLADAVADSFHEDQDLIAASGPDVPAPSLVEGEPAMGDPGATADVAALAEAVPDARAEAEADDEGDEDERDED